MRVRPILSIVQVFREFKGPSQYFIVLDFKGMTGIKHERKSFLVSYKSKSSTSYEKSLLTYNFYMMAITSFSTAG